MSRQFTALCLKGLNVRLLPRLKLNTLFTLSTHKRKSNGCKACFCFPFYGMKQYNYLIFEDIMKHTMKKFISNLLALFAYNFAPEREHSGRGGRGGLES